MHYIVTIGLETHFQLKTATKMFCGCALQFGAEPNTNICPGCLGYPGALPTVNEEALRLTAMAGMMLGCQINNYSVFDRKNYFYPDMSKNCQVTQDKFPLCSGGGVSIKTPAGEKFVRINHIHLEEDAAKINHYATYSGIDFNRGSCPLMEIVSEPDMNSIEEVMEYVQALKQIMLYADVSECNLEEGNMRSDVNISLAPAGSKVLGTRVEIKNMNTFRGIRDALEYEINRQLRLLQAGGTVLQETRRWDAEQGETHSMRDKVDAPDYRYFPEPDILPVLLAQEQIEFWRSQLPEPPGTRKTRMIAEYGIPEYDAGVLSDDRSNADFFEATVALTGPNSGKSVSNWFMTEVLRLLGESKQSINECSLTPAALAELVGLVANGTINGLTAKEVLAEIFVSGAMPAALVAERGLAQVSDTSALEAMITEVFAANEKSVSDYRAGKEAAARYLIGQVMKLSKGKADPKVVGKMVQERLVGDSERSS